jgi:hypothetical protein
MEATDFSHPAWHRLSVKLNLTPPPSTSRAPPSRTPPHHPHRSTARTAHHPTAYPHHQAGRHLAAPTPVVGTTTRPRHRVATKRVESGYRPPALAELRHRPLTLPPPTTITLPPPSQCHWLTLSSRHCCWSPSSSGHQSVASSSSLKRLSSPPLPRHPARVSERTPPPPHC